MLVSLMDVVCFAKMIKYNHNDMEDLERALKAVPEKAVN